MTFQSDWQLRERYFSEEEMVSWLREAAREDHLPNMDRAIGYMTGMHEGQYRKPLKYLDRKIPYRIHPLTMTCHGYALGIRDDAVLTALLLHDVCEDCGVAAADLPFPEEIRTLVDLVTKKEDGGLTGEAFLRQYYGGIAKNGKAALVKVIDRCHNITTMGQALRPEEISAYISETETWVMPLLDLLEERQTDRALTFLLRYQMTGILETLKVMLLDMASLQD